MTRTVSKLPPEPIWRQILYEAAFGASGCCRSLRYDRYARSAIAEPERRAGEGECHDDEQRLGEAGRQRNEETRPPCDPGAERLTGECRSACEESGSRARSPRVRFDVDQGDEPGKTFPGRADRPADTAFDARQEPAGRWI